MSEKVTIANVSFTPAQPKEVKRGLLGWVSLVLDGRFRLSSIAVRRTLDGRVTLSFPTRIDGSGRQRFYFRPLDDRTRRAIESQVFTQLGLTERAPR